jgi:hypothetical protein
MKQADLRDMFKKAYKSTCKSNIVVSPDLLPPTPSTSSTMKTPEITEEDTDCRELADEGHMQMEYFCD